MPTTHGVAKIVSSKQEKGWSTVSMQPAAAPIADPAKVAEAHAAADQYKLNKTGGWTERMTQCRQLQSEVRPSASYCPTLSLATSYV